MIEAREVDAVDDRIRQHAVDVGRRGVVSELELVDGAIAQHTLEVDDGVGRVVRHVQNASGHCFRLVGRALVM